MNDSFLSFIRENFNYAEQSSIHYYSPAHQHAH
jgi:hypothetical protein